MNYVAVPPPPSSPGNGVDHVYVSHAEVPGWKAPFFLYRELSTWTPLCAPRQLPQRTDSQGHRPVGYSPDYHYHTVTKQYYPTTHKLHTMVKCF